MFSVNIFAVVYCPSTIMMWAVRLELQYVYCGVTPYVNIGELTHNALERFPVCSGTKHLYCCSYGGGVLRMMELFLSCTRKGNLT